jgi:hypothetical protein
MKYCFTGVLLAITLTASTQPCNCLDDFYFIKNHIEKNHGGFNKKIKSPGEPAYRAFVRQLEADIRHETNPVYCISYLKKYILYLQDHHSTISPGTNVVVREDSDTAVNAFLKSRAYLDTEVIAVNDTLEAHWSRYPPKGIEGIYSVPDSTYVVAIIPSKTERRDYAAIILSSKTKLWTKGQVKMELKQVNDSLFDAYIFLRNHSLQFEQLAFANSRLELNGWIKAGMTGRSSPLPADTQLIHFSVPETGTALLSIRSFSAFYLNRLDSAYRKLIPEIKKYPRLIIDVRDNGGGSDQGFSQLMPFIYTAPYDNDVMEYFSTPDNIKAYQEYDDNLQKNNPGNRPVFSEAISLMKKTAPYSFVSTSDGKPTKVTSNRHQGNPQKVAILFNRGCASSCESLLFAARNSSKTILVGENSGGFTGYGNVMTLLTPCGNRLSWTTTVYRNQWQYEMVGIPPDHRIPADEKDWVAYTVRLLAAQ